MSREQNPISRRRLLRSAGLLAGVAGAFGLAACDTAPSGAGGPSGGGGPSAGGAGGPTGGTSGGTGPLLWWDQFNPLQDLQKATFERFTADGGPEVQYTVYNPAEQGQALQLAQGSGQLPDVFTLAGVGVPAAVLRDQGWFSPLSTGDAIRDALPEGSLVPGIHVFDDQVYSFSIFSFRQYETLLWFNRGLLERAGVDPEQPPASWDDLRAAARAVQDAGSSGLILPLQFPDRLQAFVLELAQTAGFPGSRESGTNGIDLTTGEYRFHDDAFVEAIEFLLSFQQDGLLFPASTSLDARSGRARWAADGAGFFLDGPYCAGVVAGDFAAFLPQLGVGAIPTPGGDAPVLTRPPTGGTFWASGQSDQVDQVSELLTYLVDEEYQRGLAEAMDQPPLDLAAVAGSDAHETYKQCIEFFAEQVFLGPSPQARAGVTAVEAAMTPVQPTLGDIVQGAFSGQVDDVRGALRTLSDGMTRAREAAIAQVGGDVTAESWAFPDWSPGTDFGPEEYAG
ncbi:ABC transporter substrate-binding protein [Jiangella rhizosphaerae]|uniref:Extracellular solute-binding protein n=1 Tax=Jiangella rhizosphaerae TaxID=2293569 RepID=A0A418KQF5_9ACTN|nr:extracellular solute-binding protein [Jiangella rhizosphaerae]RIQ22777.1 extracellular solute-binding protein [Jiangella rhizosphaerae]